MGLTRLFVTFQYSLKVLSEKGLIVLYQFSGQLNYAVIKARLVYVVGLGTVVSYLL